MPSTIGHLLGGVAAAWSADLVPGERRWRSAPPTAGWFRRAGNGLTVACALLAAASDVDVLWGGHRGATHSVLAVALVGLLGAAIAANARRPVLRVGLMCAAAFATHLLLDWLGVDNRPPRGLQMLWPFSDRWFISDLDVFPGTARERPWTPQSMRINVVAVAWEIAVLLPVVIGLGLIRVKALARFAAEMPRGDHAPQ